MVYFSISLEKGNWLKLKEESNLHFIHQLSKDLQLKIIFKNYIHRPFKKGTENHAYFPTKVAY